jgi:formylglycine-generating enzyme required for sulfatase activity
VKTLGSNDSAPIRRVAYQPPDAGVIRRKTQLVWPALVGGVLLVVALVFGFLFTANTVRIATEPPEAHVALSGGLAVPVGDTWLLHEGDWHVTATATGYAPASLPILVTGAASQRFDLTLMPLPGIVTVRSSPAGAEVRVGDRVLGTTPLEDVSLPAGPVTLEFRLDRYDPMTLDTEILGREQRQTISPELMPGWADVTLTSTPEGAEIFVDDAPTGLTTPAVVPVAAGERTLRITAPRHRSHERQLLVVAREPVTLPNITLVRADGLLRIRTQPPDAGITINGQYRGQSPLELAVQSGSSYRIQAYRAGFDAATTEVQLDAEGERAVNLALTRLTGRLAVVTEPAEAKLYVNGRDVGSANQTVTLPTGRQSIEVRAPGYAAYTTQVEPREGVTQTLRVRLLSVADARLAALKPEIRTPQGETLVLLKPGTFTMGASRRQPGRRANETEREVALQRFFYLGTREVRNGDFKRFIADHDSGSFQDTPLNGDDQPVVSISWEQAARYCNWLSRQERLPLFYRESGNRIVGIDPSATGYRLPTEAEWEWAARQVPGEAGTDMRFAWGQNLPPPDRHGNYADRSAANLVGRIIFGYNDNHITSAPVGTFKASPIGIHDLSGNVAEWVNDFHEIPKPEPVRDPLGPAQGQHHVIRGSSWMHGTVTELRIAFRDYGNDGRQDVGFRLARFAEAE